ncbi:hypothetical protein CBS63078_10872 [Aspergillus niger]|nr:hypothetical protein CBS115989_7397 [Aspergillus niger]KAI2834113.1 hypothetical protein CBS11350_10962 [Aspergillus niger]KAI2850206.1 hypothetical protein CBS11232_6316 [Aspergillus niger]KAI2868670.1 hypothetical protein CBS115988_10569 [Aspergillus niger]KAI2884992.1 hypothetical protein CBS11852_8460 [Aspergillus niger]
MTFCLSRHFGSGRCRGPKGTSAGTSTQRGVNSGLVPPRAGHAACACRPNLLGILLSFARQYSPPPASPVPKIKLQTSGVSTAKKK